MEGCLGVGHNKMNLQAASGRCSTAVRHDALTGGRRDAGRGDVAGTPDDLLCTMNERPFTTVRMCTD